MSAVPWADVVAIKGRTVTVTCPYCTGRHAHYVENLGNAERRAPGCGLARSTTDRTAGYRFTTRKAHP